MKSHKSIVQAIGASVGIALLILDSKTALSGATEGIHVCLKTVIPSLFPFFVLSILLTVALVGTSLPLSKGLHKLFGIPSGAESLLLVGLLGGYPVGAQSVAQSYASGSITRADAQRMLCFCSNAGPAFIFGICGSQFPSLQYPFLLWLLHMASALLIAGLLPGKSCVNAKPISGSKQTISKALEKSTKIMANVCGWVVLFKVFLAIGQRWFLWLLPPTIQVAVTSLLELANGCLSLAHIANTGVRFVICAGALGFGGICVLMQTASVIGTLDIRSYFWGKVLHCVFSLYAAYLLQGFLFPKGDCLPIAVGPCIAFLTVACILTYFLKKTQKTSSNPMLVGV